MTRAAAGTRAQLEGAWRRYHESVDARADDVAAHLRGTCHRSKRNTFLSSLVAEWFLKSAAEVDAYPF
eukprot:COSAG06_NODE_838_length_12005_cov_473.630354_1_plen_68_part_00